MQKDLFHNIELGPERAQTSERGVLLGQGPLEGVGSIIAGWWHHCRVMALKSQGVSLLYLPILGAVTL